MRRPFSHSARAARPQPGSRGLRIFSTTPLKTCGAGGHNPQRIPNPQSSGDGGGRRSTKEEIASSGHRKYTGAGKHPPDNDTLTLEIPVHFREGVKAGDGQGGGGDGPIQAVEAGAEGAGVENGDEFTKWCIC
jgi:hypothetical protein